MFSFELPHRTASQSEAEPRAADEPSGEKIVGKAFRILLVEDEPGVRNAMRMLLDIEGYGVTTAATAKEAMQLVRGSNEFDLLVTDYHLEGGSTGTQVIAAARESINDSFKAILVTGDTSSAVREMQGDANLRIASKPINPDELLALVKTLARRVTRSSDALAGSRKFALTSTTSHLLASTSLLDRHSKELATPDRWLMAPSTSTSYSRAAITGMQALFRSAVEHLQALAADMELAHELRESHGALHAQGLVPLLALGVQHIEVTAATERQEARRVQDAACKSQRAFIRHIDGGRETNRFAPCPGAREHDGYRAFASKLPVILAECPTPQRMGSCRRLYYQVRTTRGDAAADQFVQGFLVAVRAEQGEIAVVERRAARCERAHTARRLQSAVRRVR